VSDLRIEVSDLRIGEGDLWICARYLRIWASGLMIGESDMPNDADSQIVTRTHSNPTSKP
jgi:hypothetical protein